MNAAPVLPLDAAADGAMLVCMSDARCPLAQPLPLALGRAGLASALHV